VHGLEDDATEDLDAVKAGLLGGVEEEVPHVGGVGHFDGKAIAEAGLEVTDGLAVQVLEASHVAGVFGIEQVGTKEVVDGREGLEVQAMPVDRRATPKHEAHGFDIR